MESAGDGSRSAVRTRPNDKQSDQEYKDGAAQYRGGGSKRECSQCFPRDSSIANASTESGSGASGNLATAPHLQTQQQVYGLLAVLGVKEEPSVNWAAPARRQEHISNTSRKFLTQTEPLVSQQKRVIQGQELARAAFSQQRKKNLSPLTDFESVERAATITSPDKFKQQQWTTKAHQKLNNHERRPRVFADPERNLTRRTGEETERVYALGQETEESTRHSELKLRNPMCRLHLLERSAEKCAKGCPTASQYHVCKYGVSHIFTDG